ncbi:MAG: hypothetical protein LBU42_07795 [Prevotellaceae bacterium]|nr:hypothetical protein [Prevotellaceae bacterium]
MGATWNSLPLARSKGFPLCTDSAPRERQWGLHPQAALRWPAVMKIRRFTPYTNGEWRVENGELAGAEFTLR